MKCEANDVLRARSRLWVVVLECVLKLLASTWVQKCQKSGFMFVSQLVCPNCFFLFLFGCP